MNLMRRLAIFIIILVTASVPSPAVLAETGSSTSIALAQQHRDEETPKKPILSSVTISFHTNDDDKDPDTLVFVTINLSNRTKVAHIDQIEDAFSINSDSKAYPLKVDTNITEDQIPGGTILIKTTKMEGHDQWKFNFRIEMKFGEGPPIKREFSGVSLQENKQIERIL